MAEISLRGVCKTYSGNVNAVTDFNLEIADKEFTILVGPSGCGKSTVLRMIAGLEEITSGEITIGGKCVNDIPAKDRDIAMVFQGYALYPHKTVYENMAYGLRLRKTPKDEIDRRIHEAAGILEIEHLLDRKPKALSGGERQRVAIGRAIVRHPAVFLFDEPLSNLDAKLRASMRSELKKLHERLGATFIYVTHDQTEAMTMGDKIVVMEKGVIRQAGAPKEIYNHPKNAFTAGFIGSPQMNLLQGVLDKSEIIFDTQRIMLPYANDVNGKTVSVGIRPNDIRIADEPQENTVTATVELIESLGSESYLHLDFNGMPLLARVSADIECQVGEVIKLALDTQKIYLFDAETGEAL